LTSSIPWQQATVRFRLVEETPGMKEETVDIQTLTINLFISMASSGNLAQNATTVNSSYSFAASSTALNAKINYTANLSPFLNY
jgi:hypothetical protein